MPKILKSSSLLENLPSKNSRPPFSILSVIGVTLSDINLSPGLPSSLLHALVFIVFYLSSSTLCLASCCLSFYLLIEKNLLCKLLDFFLIRKDPSRLYGFIDHTFLSSLSVFDPFCGIVTLLNRVASLFLIVIF